MSIAAAICAPGVNRRPRSTVLRIVGGFAGNCDVMDVAFAQPRRGDANKGAVLLHLADCAVACITHRSPQSADQLVDDVTGGSLVGDAAFDTFGHELQCTRDFLLKITVG